MSVPGPREAYERYLNSPEWEARRQAALRRDGHRCTGCSATERLHVHHLTYERVGHERLTDLMTLCHVCHAREHGLTPDVGPIAGPTDAEITERVRAQEHAAVGLRLMELDGYVAKVEEAFIAADVVMKEAGYSRRDRQPAGAGVRIARAFRRHLREAAA